MENIITTFLNRNRIFFKTFLIGALILVLLIPAFFIQNLVSERQQRHREAVDEISSRWAGTQTVTGPVIGIPYLETIPVDATAKAIKKWAYFLPGKLNIKAHMVPEKRHRGIYEVIVYTAELQISGSFDSLNLEALNITPRNILWNEGAVFFDISDIQGLKEDMVLHLSGTELEMAPGRFSNDQFKNALSAPLPADMASRHSLADFSTTVKIKGTGNLWFVPLGKETKAQVGSPWPDPSFNGTYLPDVRTVKDSGFLADWKVLSLNRKYPQQWKDAAYNLENAVFGVNLIIPVDAYQQTTRSVKYAILVILLTFTAFLLIEWIYNRTIHSLQYLLVGLALCLFYTLLLSFSEYTGFNAAYGIAALATIGLIAWYVKSVLQSAAMATFIGFLLVLQYGLIYTLIQLQDYALLIGSIGLFVTLAVVMYFSRKIKWN